MTTYDYKTDAVSGEVEAATLDAALKRVVSDEQITDKLIGDGAWAWVEDPATGERERIGKGETMTHWKLTSVKGTWEFEGTEDEAIEKANELQAEYQAAFGIAVEDEDGDTVATID